MKPEWFLKTIAAQNRDTLEVARQTNTLVALSGGADSVAMLRALIALGCECRAAHCNFHLRGKESMRDERFVRELCQQLGIPLTVRDFDVDGYRLEHGGSMEMACRELRYRWFEEERQQQQCRFIAVAHHAGDQVETFFLNLMRGTGTRGLAGMRRLNGCVWRPLLEVSRADILNYLAAIGQDHVTDSTNADNDIRRNRLRNIVLPTIEQQFPQANRRILDTMRNVGEDHRLLMATALEKIPDACHIDIQTIKDSPLFPTLLYYRIRHMGFNRNQCRQAIAAALSGRSGRQFIGQGYVLHVNRKSLDIEPIVPKIDVEITIDLNQGICHPIGVVVSRNNPPFSPRMCDGKRIVAFQSRLLDCKRITVRHWRQGDRMKPFGLNGSKLISDLFADYKLKHDEKRNTWLMEADGQIVWLIGYRSSALYPVEQGSRDYILLQLQ